MSSARHFFISLITYSTIFSTTFAQGERPPSAAAPPSYTTYNNITRDFAPMWSPDGKQIAYYSGSRSTGFKLHIVSLRGGASKPIFDDQYDYFHPAWSPDGHRLAFTSNRSGQFQVWAMKPDGTDLKQLTSISADYLVYPRWSPDGKQIAFASYPGPHIWITSANGGEPKIIADGISPAWSPDGKRVAFTATFLNSSWAAIKEIGGSETRMLASSSTESGAGFAEQTVDWSPDGQRLLTTELSDGAWHAQIINIAEDKVERKIPVDGSVVAPRWSPDGKRIVFSLENTDRPLAIQVSNLDGAERKEVTRPESYNTAQLIRYQSADGVVIPGFLYSPRPAGQAKRPALVWLHGGFPGVVANQFIAHIQYLVDNGFVVLIPAYRPSSGFGKELAKLDNPQKTMEDIAAAVSYLHGLQQVDGLHIGIIGESFGGLAMLNLIAQQPDLFAAAVDFYGPTDLITWYRDTPGSRPLLMLGLGGTPEQKPDLYRAFSPVNVVERIKIPLLIVHGDADESVPLSQASELVEALKKAHKEHEYVVIRGGDHGFFRKGMAEAMPQTLRFLSARLRR